MTVVQAPPEGLSQTKDRSTPEKPFWHLELEPSPNRSTCEVLECGDRAGSAGGCAVGE